MSNNENEKAPKKQNSSSNEVEINNLNKLKKKVVTINTSRGSITTQISAIKNDYDKAVSNFKAKKAKTWLYANTKNVANFKVVEAKTQAAAKVLSGELIQLSNRIDGIMKSINKKLNLEKSNNSKSPTVTILQNLLTSVKSINLQVEKLKTSATKLESRQYKFYA